MSTPQFGSLEPVELRDGWPREDTDFTPWLAEEPNIQYLGRTLGLELEVIETERGIGPFRADIVCRDVLSDTIVLIENQLERTDHTHLGQVITYAAGLEAVHIIWIAKSFTEEHRAAIDWLNRVTDESCNVFGVEIQLWKIGDSPIAPRMNIVAKPNEWTKQASAAKRATMGSSSPRGTQFRELWSKMAEHFTKKNPPFPVPAPKGMNWVHVPLHPELRLILSCAVNSNRGKVYIFRSRNAPPWFGALYEHREALDAVFVEAPEWILNEDEDGHAVWVHESSKEGNAGQREIFDWLFERVVDIQDHLLPVLTEILDS